MTKIKFLTGEFIHINGFNYVISDIFGNAAGRIVYDPSNNRMMRATTYTRYDDEVIDRCNRLYAETKCKFVIASDKRERIYDELHPSILKLDDELQLLIKSGRKQIKFKIIRLYYRWSVDYKMINGDKYLKWTTEDLIENNITS